MHVETHANGLKAVLLWHEKFIGFRMHFQIFCVSNERWKKRSLIEWQLVETGLWHRVPTNLDSIRCVLGDKVIHRKETELEGRNPGNRGIGIFSVWFQILMFISLFEENSYYTLHVVVSGGNKALHCWKIFPDWSRSQPSMAWQLISVAWQNGIPPSPAELPASTCLHLDNVPGALTWSENRL